MKKKNIEFKYDSKYSILNLVKMTNTNMVFFTEKSRNEVHNYIYTKFTSTNDGNILNNMIDNNLYDCNNIVDVILNYRDFLTSIMSCMYTLDVRMKIIHHFFDIIVDYIIEDNCYDQFDDFKNLFIILVYISPEKLYDYINYIYISSNEENKNYIKTHIFDKIYMSIVYNGYIVTMVKYGYGTNEEFENIIYPYYLLIERLQKANILEVISDKIENNAYELIDCVNSSELLYMKIVTNVLNDMKVHIKK